LQIEEYVKEMKAGYLLKFVGLKFEVALRTEPVYTERKDNNSQLQSTSGKMEGYA